MTRSRHGLAAVARSSKALAAIFGLALAAALFQAVFGWGIVAADAAYWRSPYGDMITMLAGAEAVFQDPWTFPLTATRRLTSPELTAVIYTDSIPWLLVVMKALGLQRHFNLLGLFLALAYLLQPVAMITLLRAAGAKRLATLTLGAALALLLPIWIVRQFGHVALGGHFVLIFALALSVDSARRGLTPGRVLLFCGLGALAAGIHAYHVIPVSAAFVAAALAEITQQRSGAWVRAFCATLGFGLATGAAAFVLGYGVGDTISGGADAVGVYSMNLAAPILPQASILAGQRWDTTANWFTGTPAGPPSQNFEGFAYLGGGVLLLVAIALVLRVGRRSPGESQSPRRFGPLAVAMVALTLWAVGPHAYLGGVSLIDLPIPGGAAGDLLGFFRAHGRFVWAPSYALLALVLIWLEQGLRPRLLAGLALVALALQAVDVSGLLTQISARYAAPWPTAYPDALENPAFAGRAWVFQPRYHCTLNASDQVTLSQLSLLAIRHGGVTSSANTARDAGGDCAPPAELLTDAGPGDPRLTIVIDSRKGASPRFAEFAGRGDCRRFTTVLACGRGLTPGVAPTLALAELRRPFELDFRSVEASPNLRKGWSGPEPEGVWSAVANTQIVFPAPIYADRGMTLHLHAYAFKPQHVERQHVLVTTRKIPLILWRMIDVPAVYRVDVPPGIVKPGEDFFLDFFISDPVPVSQFLPGSTDGRQLGVNVRRLRVGPLEPRPSPAR